MSQKTIYRNAAALAAIQLDRPFSARDIARIHACIVMAEITENPHDSETYNYLAGLVQVAGTVSEEVQNRLSPMATLEEAVDDATKRIVGAFAPRLPKVEEQNE